MYKMEPILDDPRYEGFGCYDDDEPSLRHPEDPYSSRTDDFFPDQVESRDWEVPRLKSIWKPLRVVGRVRPYNDYPCVGMLVPAFSERAVEALRDILDANGELLPLVSDVGRYYAYNVTTVADALDLEKSQIKWMNKSELVLAQDIERYEFVPEKVASLTIFRLSVTTTRYYVTDTFVRRFDAAGLRGANFIRVWPLPPGMSWRELEKQRERQRQRRGLPPGQTLKGNTVVIRLVFRGKRTGPTASEQKKIEELMDALDAYLLTIDPDAPPVGCLEGHEYTEDVVPGECRLFLSCPDADRLAEELIPVLRGFRWPGKVFLLKRYGEYVNPDAREEYVDF